MIMPFIELNCPLEHLPIKVKPHWSFEYEGKEHKIYRDDVEIVLGVELVVFNNNVRKILNNNDYYYQPNQKKGQESDFTILLKDGNTIKATWNK